MTQPFDVLGLNKNLMGLNKISWDSTFSKMVSPRTQHLRFLLRTLTLLVRFLFLLAYFF